MCSLASPHHLSRFGLGRPSKPSSTSPATNIPSVRSVASVRSHGSIKPLRAEAYGKRKPDRKHRSGPVATMDEDSIGVSFADEGEGVAGGNGYYVISSSDGEGSDGDPFVNPAGDVDLPAQGDRRRHMDTPDSGFAVAAHRFASIQTGRRRNRRLEGVLVTLGLVALAASFCMLVDYCAWKITRLPLDPFFLTKPLAISAVMSALAGFIYAPVADSLKIHVANKKQGHSVKRITPTMGGLFFIPVGITVGKIVGFNSIEVNGAAIVTLVFSLIGLLDDIPVVIRNHDYQLPRWAKLFLQVSSGMCFSIWLESADVSTPYNMKLLVPLPPPFGLVYLGDFYRVVVAFCFATMCNGVTLSDGHDGLAGGTAALAFIGISVAALPISPDISVLGVSLAGACIGFLFHNRYKASICMGNIGSQALGGALAAIAASTGMFLPLLISTGVFVMEIFSILLKVVSVLATKRSSWKAWHISRLAPLHYHLTLHGLMEPRVAACAYVLSFLFALYGGYVGLVSA